MISLAKSVAYNSSLLGLGVTVASAQITLYTGVYATNKVLDCVIFTKDLTSSMLTLGWGAEEYLKKQLIIILSSVNEYAKVLNFLIYFGPLYFCVGCLRPRGT